MNEIDLTKILKDCPKGTKLYSTIYGEVTFSYINNSSIFPIIIRVNDDFHPVTTKDGRHSATYKGECTLFPSKDQRDWSKFTAPWHLKEKFDPKTLKSFDKVLVRDNKWKCWVVQLFSHIIEGELHYPYLCINNSYKYCIPYNDYTKHLVGTTEDAPEFYRY